MSKWIDADALHDALKAKQRWVVRCGDKHNEGYTCDQVHFAIDNAPSIDIVQCRECKYYNGKYCFNSDGSLPVAPKPDDFCSYGCRKEQRMIKEYTYLGRTRNGECCILKSTLPKNEITANALELKPTQFVHSSTNWGGCDDFDRTCKLRHLKATGEELDISKNPLIFSGVDCDMGHEYLWQISVERITFCEEDEQGVRTEKLARSINSIESSLWFLKKDFTDRVKVIEEELSKLERMV